MAQKQTKTTRPAPSQAPLTQEELDFFHDLLLKERANILNRIRRYSDARTTTRQAGEEMADVGSDNFIRETNLSMIGDEAERMRMIDTALQNIQNNSYGICQECGRRIGVARLKAKPYARYCIDCKESQEAQEPHFRHV